MNEITISDIQLTSNQKGAKITFCDNEGNDFLDLTLNKDQLWEIVDFCKRNLSYAAELKKQKQQFGILGIKFPDPPDIKLFLDPSK